MNDISKKNTFLLLALPQMLDITPDVYFIFCLVPNNGCEADIILYDNAKVTSSIFFRLPAKPTHQFSRTSAVLPLPLVYILHEVRKCPKSVLLLPTCRLCRCVSGNRRPRPNFKKRFKEIAIITGRPATMGRQPIKFVCLSWRNCFRTFPENMTHVGSCISHMN